MCHYHLTHWILLRLSRLGHLDAVVGYEVMNEPQ